jgi:hypothetical protein
MRIKEFILCGHMSHHTPIVFKHSTAGCVFSRFYQEIISIKLSIFFRYFQYSKNQILILFLKFRYLSTISIYGNNLHENEQNCNLVVKYLLQSLHILHVTFLHILQMGFYKKFKCLSFWCLPHISSFGIVFLFGTVIWFFDLLIL